MKYEIEIGISEKSKPGTGMAGSTVGAVAAKYGKHYGLPPGKSGTESLPHRLISVMQQQSHNSRDMVKALLANTKAQIKQTTETIQASRVYRTAAAVGRGGAAVGRGVSSAVSFGMGATPFIGFVFRVLSKLTGKIMQVGRQFDALALAQQDTAGLGGFQRSGFGGEGGYLTPGQKSAAMKSRALAGGHPITGWKFERDKLAEAEDLRGLKLATRMGTFFGAGPEAYSKIVGLQDIFTGGGGGAAFQRNMIKARAGNIRQGEMPVMLNMLASTLEEAVRDGVKSSGVADDMIKGILRYSGSAARGGGVRFAQEIVQTNRQAGVQISRGQISSLENFGRVSAARQSIFTPWGLKALSGGNKNIEKEILAMRGDTEAEMALAQKLARLRPEGVAEVHGRNVRETIQGGIQGSSYRKQLLGAFRAQRTGIMSGTLTQIEARMREPKGEERIYDMFRDKKESEAERLKKSYRMPGQLASALGREVAVQTFQLGTGPAKAAEAVHKLDLAAIKLAETLLKSKIIDTFLLMSNAAEKIATGAKSFIDEIDKATKHKEGVGAGLWEWVSSKFKPW